MTGKDSLHGLGEFIKQRREATHKSIRDLAKIAGVSNPYLSQIERGIRRPSASVLQQIARGLEISAETLYVQAGILDPESPSATDVIAAIHNDPQLSEDQRHQLIGMYQRFIAAGSSGHDSGN